MKIALLNPLFGRKIHYKTPLGLAYISALLEKNNIENKIIYGEDFDSFEDFKNYIKRINPDILGITVMTINLENAIKAAKVAKEAVPGIKIIFGGAHPTMKPEEVIKNDVVDIVCVGESEFTFLEIAQNKKLEEIKGILFKKNGKIIKNPPREIIKNLDILPFPARHKLKMKKHIGARPSMPIMYPATTLIASRGCPGNCLFCQPVLRGLFGKLSRYRSTDNVIEEMVMLKKVYKIKSLYFDDNELLNNREWVLEFCNKLIERKINIPWACASRVDNISEEVAKKLKKSGCYFVSMGVESGSQEVLNYYRKGITIEQIKNAFALCREYKILTHASFMIGAPNETKEDINKTIGLIKKIKPDLAMINATTPNIGTDMYQEALENNLINEQDLTKLERHNLSTMKRKYLSEDDVKNAMKTAFRAYWMEIIKITINPLRWYKRGYTIKGLITYWTSLLSNPKLILEGFEWYFKTLFALNVKKKF